MRRTSLFFSSCFQDPLGERLHIRDRVATLNGGDQKRVWLAEDFTELDPSSTLSPLEKALFCVEGVRQTGTYVAVVRSRHGSGVDLAADERTQASFFELELFEAALLGKPALIFILKGAELSDRLEGLLRLLAPAFPGLSWTPLDEEEIYRRMSQLVEIMDRPWRRLRLNSAAPSLRRASDQLTGQRSQRYNPSNDLPPFQFLGGRLDRSASMPSEAVVEDLLGRASQEPSHHIRLVLLWMALRELMGAPPGTPGSQAYELLWERALGDWTRSGAWYGLHGHLLMGCLGSLGSLARIQARRLGRLASPHGPLASEYYSIAKQLSLPRLRTEILELARLHIDAAIYEGTTSGKLAIRASIHREAGRMPEAIEDYETVVRLRTDEGASPEGVGEAKSELGYALMLAGARRRGLTLLEEGDELLTSDPPNGFTVRAKRKLGVGYFRSGAPQRALRTLADAHHIAMRYGMLDQIGKWERAAAWLDRRLPRFGRGSSRGVS
jgi:tetratricopeptide (TPR) repeat protein